MALELHHLDERTRHFMLNEFEQDVAQDRLYLSPRLSERGRQDYPDLLRTALTTGDDDSLAASLGREDRLSIMETRQMQGGRITTARVPATAAATLAEGEFNRFYARGLCRRAIEDGVSAVEVCRVRYSQHPRPESQAMIGSMIDPRALLDDLRSHVGVEPALKLPPGPNSGLSVRLASTVEKTD